MGDVVIQSARGARHNQLIDELVAQGASRKGFPSAIRNQVGGQFVIDPFRFRFVPDAFAVDGENFKVTLYEVEVTNPVSATKMRNIAYFWFSLDSEDWDCSLIIVDRHGGQHEVCLCTEYMRMIRSKSC